MSCLYVFCIKFNADQIEDFSHVKFVCTVSGLAILSVQLNDVVFDHNIWISGQSFGSDQEGN